MKEVLIWIYLLFIAITSTFAQQTPKKILLFDSNKPIYTLDASCGTCMFKMKGKDCNLAVKYNDTCYFVSGTDIDDHGDAHSTAGFCNAIRKAKVQGTVKDGKFAVTFFELLKP